MKYSVIHKKRIRFHFFWNLVLSLLFLACTENKKERSTITIQWNGEKAEAVQIPVGLLPGIVKDSLAELLQVRLLNNAAPILHDELSLNNETVIFKPLIAFTPGLRYEVLFSNKPVGQFEIPALSMANRTEIVSIFPTVDTLPENALKLYIVFSKPMQEGQALNNITVIKNDNDTLQSTFLHLDQELWNKERTTLTLWFDPGRVKRDLQPNKNLGLPLQENNRYKIIIAESWRDERGIILKSGYQKEFIVGKRDNHFPNPENWTIYQPKAGTKEGLRIELHESLDYLLLKNAVHIIDRNGKTVDGTFVPMAKETVLTFTPDGIWNRAEYIINIESRLEDLAGNNLNRLFDKDLTKPDNREQKAIFSRKFRVD